MMHRDLSHIQATVKDILCSELNTNPQLITNKTGLREIPGIESLKFLRVILCVEEHYRIELEEKVVFSVNTLEDIAVAVANCLEGELQAAGGGQHV